MTPDELLAAGWIVHSVTSNNAPGKLCSPATCPCYHGCLHALAVGEFPEAGRATCALANVPPLTAENIRAALNLVR